MVMGECFNKECMPR